MQTRILAGFCLDTIRPTSSSTLPPKTFTKYPKPGAMCFRMSQSGLRVSIAMLTIVRVVGRSATSFPPSDMMSVSSAAILSRMNESCPSSPLSRSAMVLSSTDVISVQSCALPRRSSALLFSQ